MFLQEGGHTLVCHRNPCRTMHTLGTSLLGPPFRRTRRRFHTTARCGPLLFHLFFLPYVFTTCVIVSRWNSFHRNPLCSKRTVKIRNGRRFHGDSMLRALRGPFRKHTRLLVVFFFPLFRIYRMERRRESESRKSQRWWCGWSAHICCRRGGERKK